MKKTLAALLTIALLCAGAFALAEEEAIQIDITFDGTYIEVEDLGFKILLPNDWNILETEDYYMAFSSDDQAQTLAIDVFEAEGYTLLDIAGDVALEEGFESLVRLTINGIPFVLYEAPELGVFGGFTNTQENVYCIHFIFGPYGDEGFMSLAEQIMASIDVL